MKKIVILLLAVLLCPFAAIFASADSFSLTEAEEEFPFPAGQTLWYRFVCGASLSWELEETKDLKTVLRNCDQLPVEGGCTRDVFYVLYPDGQDPSDPKTPLSYWRYSPRFGFNDDVERDPEMMKYFQQNMNRGKEILGSVGVDAEIREVLLYYEVDFGAYLFYVSDRGIYTLCRDFKWRGSDESYLFSEEKLTDIFSQRVAYSKSLPPNSAGREWDLSAWSEYRIDLSALPDRSVGAEGIVPAETGSSEDGASSEAVPGSALLSAETNGEAVSSSDTEIPAALKIAVAVVTVGLIAAALLVFFRKRNEENIIG